MTHHHSPDSVRCAKAQLRHQIRASFEAADVAALEGMSRRVQAAVACHPRFVAAKTVALYWSLPAEFPTHSWVREWAEQRRILLPIMEGEGLVWAPFEGEERLVQRRFGVMEPQSSERVPLTEVDLLLVPGVAFTPTGERLGHGKGFYDRTLAQCIAHGSKRPLTVGLCFDFQLRAELPSEAWDVAVDELYCGSEAQIRHYTPLEIR